MNVRFYLLWLHLLQEHLLLLLFAGRVRAPPFLLLEQQRIILIGVRLQLFFFLDICKHSQRLAGDKETCHRLFALNIHLVATLSFQAVEFHQMLIRLRAPKKRLALDTGVVMEVVSLESYPHYVVRGPLV
jgi:hypothetical protein